MRCAVCAARGMPDMCSALEPRLPAVCVAQGYASGDVPRVGVWAVIRGTDRPDMRRGAALWTERCPPGVFGNVRICRACLVV